MGLLGVCGLGRCHGFWFVELERGQSQLVFALLIESLQLLVVALLHVGVFAKYACHSGDSFVLKTDAFARGFHALYLACQRLQLVQGFQRLSGA